MVFADVTFTVTTLGLGEFPQGLSGEFTLEDFPQPGTNTRVRWQESIQNFVITESEQDPSDDQPPGGDPTCEVVSQGQSFLQIVNALESANAGLDVVFKDFPFEAIMRPGACELFGLPPGTFTVEITQCVFSADEVARGDFSDCMLVGSSESRTFSVEVGETYTLRVTESFFVNGDSPGNCMGGFFEQPSYPGDCGRRPAGTVCMAYTDGYIWLVEDVVISIERRQDCNGHVLAIRDGASGTQYHHILFTNFVKEVPAARRVVGSE
jgi:hypothetical protein